jgi:hypothetical protein
VSEHDSLPGPAVRAGLAAVLIAAAGGAAAQDESVYQRDVYGFEVLDGEGAAYEHPLLGGLNIPRPQLLDIDGDGDLDLFVQEYSGAVMYFENVGSAAVPEFRWREDAFQSADIGEWYHFADMDSDGDLDLLGEERYSGIRYYQNTGGPGAPRLELLTTAVMDFEGEPMFADRQNIPKIADLDCDGLLDLLVGRVEGTITRYEMTGLDDLGAPIFRHQEDRFQNIEIIGQVLGGSPASLQQQGAPAAAAADGDAGRGTLHGANTMALDDYDGDGDLDLFWGDFFEPGVLLIENRGSCRNVSMRGAPVPFPPRDPVSTSGYNAPAFGDLDGDGNRELLVGVLGGAFNPNNTSVDNFLHLEGFGGSRFELRTRQFLTQIDAGSESIPEWADIDGDGDLDLFLANKIEPGDTQAGRIFFFENIGTTTAPRLQLHGAMPEFQSAYHYAPAFGDVDADGDLDLVLGSWGDEVMLIVNEGSAETASWATAGEPLATLTRGRNATPALGDVDADGDLDMFVGESSGEMNFYRNVGSSAAPAYELVDDKYLGIDVGRRSNPYLFDEDGDGDLDLLIGSESEGVALYRNHGTSAVPDFRLEPDALPMVAPFSSPVLADLDGDGNAELTTGSVGGGLALYRRR